MNRQWRFAALIVAMLVTVIAPANVSAQDGAEIEACDGKVATIVGTPGGDVLIGTSGRDVIVGLGGDDVIRGGAGRDTICGGEGRDRIYGERNADRLFGGDDGDLLRGGTGDESSLQLRA